MDHGWVPVGHGPGGAWSLPFPVPGDPTLLQAQLGGQTLWIRLVPVIDGFSVSPPFCFLFGR